MHVVINCKNIEKKNKDLIFFFFFFVLDPIYIAYHDEEWGVPVHDDK